MDQNLPRLSNRRINVFNALSSDLAAFNYVLRQTKITGGLGPSTIRACNRMITNANRLFRREPDLPYIRLCIEDEPFTFGDMAIVVNRLNSLCIRFEERYHHYTEAGQNEAVKQSLTTHPLEPGAFLARNR